MSAKDACAAEHAPGATENAAADSTFLLGVPLCHDLPLPSRAIPYQVITLFVILNPKTNPDPNARLTLILTPTPMSRGCPAAAGAVHGGAAGGRLVRRRGAGALPARQLPHLRHPQRGRRLLRCRAFS